MSKAKRIEEGSVKRIVCAAGPAAEWRFIMTTTKLIELAVSMKNRAYCPYSGFAVGAALECADGSVFTGCNIESASYSPTICAERAAAAKAVSEGHTDFVRIAVAGSGPDCCWPCGVCRQLLSEFSPDGSLRVIAVDGNGRWESATLAQLLPRAFGKYSL